MPVAHSVYGLLAFCASFALGAVAAEPTDNPVASYYDGPEGYPAWTDAIRWDRILNMKTYAKGKNDFEKFENARDELAAQGGGVLCYPAGTYDFKDAPADGPKGRGLMLRKGVVIRGEAPAGKPNAVKDRKLELPTRFVFGFQKKKVTLNGQEKEVEVPRDWDLIGITPEPGGKLKDVDGVGVCWVHLVGAVIHFGPELAWGPNWKDAKSWKSAYAKPAWAGRVPDGTHPTDPFMGAPGPKDCGAYLGAGKGRLVFGCVLEKSTLLNDYDTCGRKEAPDGFGLEGFHMAKFAARIGAYGSRVFVANNLLPKSDGNFLYEQTTVQTEPRKGNDFFIGKPHRTTVMWDYGRTMGVNVNKDMLSMVRETLLDLPAGGYYEEGVAVLDNFVFNHGHKGFNLSGQWGVVRGNRNERIFQKGDDDIYGLGGDWRLTLDGFTESSPGGGGMISDNLARAFDMAGRNLWIDANSFNNTGSDPGNDGEGILCQLHGGTHWLSWALTRNVNEGSVGGNGKGFMGAFAVETLGALIAWNKTSGWVGALNPGKFADLAFVANEAGQGIRCQDKAVTESKGVPAPPKDVKAESYQGDAVKVTWTDASDNEIGFRVDRQMAGGKWTPIAYRPPHVEGSAQNPQAWVDFLAPAGQPLQYRVVAINAEDKDDGASAPTGAVTLAKPK